MPQCEKHREMYPEEGECPRCIEDRTKSKEQNFNKSGSKYLRELRCAVNGRIDVYAVIDAFDVTCPARQHALKKILCSGIRGKGDVLQDLREASDAITRAIQMEEQRGLNNG